MAISYIDSTYNFAAGTNTVTVAAPTGIQDGDILVAHAVGNTLGTFTWPSGFTQWGTGDTGASRRLGIAWKRASSESGSYVISMSGAGAIAGFVVCIRGCVSSGDPINGSLCNNADTDSDAYLDATPGVTLSEAGALLYCGFCGATGGTFDTEPSGFSSWAEDISNDPWYHGIAFKASQASGATGEVRASIGTTATEKRAQMVALKPAPSGPAAPTIDATQDGTHIDITWS